MTQYPGATHPPEPAAPPPKTSGMAIASLVVSVGGCLCLPIVGGIVGLILGFLGLGRIGRSQGRLTGRGLAIAGIILSVVSIVLYIVAAVVLFVLLTVAFTGGPEGGDLTASVSAARQLASGTLTYAAFHNDRLPPRETWDTTLLDAGLVSRECLRDRSLPPGSRAFAMNAALAGLDLRDLAAGTVMYFECDAGSPPAGGRELLPRHPRHAGRYVIVFRDGHVEPVPPDRVDSLRWNPPENLLPAEAPL